MSLVTQAFIFEKYGPRLNADEMAELLGITRPTLYNQISAGTFQIKTYLDGGKRFADYRDVAEYFDLARKMAA